MIFSRYLKHSFLKVALSTAPKRYIINSRLRRIGSSTEVERFLKNKDRIPEEFKLIYRSAAGTYIWYAKYCVALSTAAVVCLTGLNLLSQGSIIPTFVPELVYGGLVANESDLVYFSVAFVTINIVFSAIIRRYPLRIYKNIDRYIAVYESQIPFRTVQHHHFIKGTVKKIEPFLNPWKECYFQLGNRSSLLFGYYFKTPSEFDNMF